MRNGKCLARNRVGGCKQFIDAAAEHGSKGRTDDLTVEETLRGGANQVTSFEMLHHVAGLINTPFSDTTDQ